MSDPRAVYFFLLPGQVSRDNYAHTSLAIAEGLRELGYRIHANVDFWRDTPETREFVFRHDEKVRPGDCGINVFAYDWMHYINVLPRELVENSRSRRIYIEDAGWFATPGLTKPFEVFDVVLKAHFNRRCRYPGTFTPWAFGLTNRVLRATGPALPHGERTRTLLVNFGATHSYRHALREEFERRVYPRLESSLALDRRTNSPAKPPEGAYDRLMWEQTAGRHYPDYYERLNTAAVCSCIGGQLAPPIPHDWSVLGGGGRRVQLRKAFYEFASRFSRAAPRWNQWESWRFWESMSAGCATLALDFEKYGVQLPVQPENWKHYIGLDLDRLDRDVDRILSNPGLLAEVAQGGREWSRTHYSPLATAHRFLALAGQAA